METTGIGLVGVIITRGGMEKENTEGLKEGYKCVKKTKEEIG